MAGDYAVASVGAIAAFEGSRLAAVRLVVGACAAAPVRVPAADEMLLREGLSDRAVAEAGRLIVERLDPFDDTRASAAYRLKVVPRLIAKTLAALADAAQPGKVA